HIEILSKSVNFQAHDNYKKSITNTRQQRKTRINSQREKMKIAGISAISDNNLKPNLSPIHQCPYCSALSDLHKRCSISLAAQAIQEYQYIEKNNKIHSNHDYSALKRKSSISEPQTIVPYRHNEKSSHPQVSQDTAQAIQEYRYFEQNKNSQCSEYSYDIKMKTSMSTPQPNLQFSNHEQNKTPQVIQESHTYSTFPKRSPISLAAQANQEIRYREHQNQNIMVKSKNYQPSRERPNQKWITSQNQISNYLNRKICNPSISHTGATIHNNNEIIIQCHHQKDFIPLPQSLMEGSKLMKHSSHIIQSPKNPPIIIALIPNRQHYVVLELKDHLLFPAPRPLRNQHMPPSNQALGWYQKFMINYINVGIYVLCIYSAQLPVDLLIEYTSKTMYVFKNFMKFIYGEATKFRTLLQFDGEGIRVGKNPPHQNCSKIDEILPIKITPRFHQTGCNFDGEVSSLMQRKSSPSNFPQFDEILPIKLGERWAPPPLFLKKSARLGVRVRGGRTLTRHGGWRWPTTRAGNHHDGLSFESGQLTAHWPSNAGHFPEKLMARIVDLPPAALMSVEGRFSRWPLAVMDASAERSVGTLSGGNECSQYIVYWNDLRHYCPESYRIESTCEQGGAESSIDTTWHPGWHIEVNTNAEGIPGLRLTAGARSTCHINSPHGTRDVRNQVFSFLGYVEIRWLLPKFGFKVLCYEEGYKINPLGKLKLGKNNLFITMYIKEKHNPYNEKICIRKT
ncbi:hypothetical protein VP01_245g1, partial [Puccinia sorghi]